uniref:small ubiquitin-related modifier 2-like n=1 Tax=Halichoerus grypus TaxID=9711 RepID=UPI001658E329|nr:small ubiquitin-related modifier 2-like [Halichoerus grypus]
MEDGLSVCQFCGSCGHKSHWLSELGVLGANLMVGALKVGVLDVFPNLQFFSDKLGVGGSFLIFWCYARGGACQGTCHGLEKPKEGVMTENNDHINWKVEEQDGSVVRFKIKMPLSKLMKAYCERQGLSMREIRFRFDGQPINETDTPAQLDMEDEDVVDVFQQQTGGVY